MLEMQGQGEGAAANVDLSIWELPHIANEVLKQTLVFCFRIHQTKNRGNPFVPRGEFIELCRFNEACWRGKTLGQISKDGNPNHLFELKISLIYSPPFSLKLTLSMGIVQKWIIVNI